jgi:hypothetical protein
LAPGYVPPNGGKDKPSKVHHWVEVQRAKAKTSSDLEDGNLGDNSDNSSVSSPSTPLTQPTQPMKQSHHVARHHSGPPLEKPHHPRMASWRAGRSNLSDGEGIGGPADLEEVPVGVKRQALRLDDYYFPDHRLRTVMDGISPLTNYGRLVSRRRHENSTYHRCMWILFPNYIPASPDV